MYISTKHIRTVLLVLTWIIFVGLCIEACGFIFNSFFSLAIKPVAAKQFWNGLDFSSLYAFDKGQFFVVTLFMIIVAVSRAILFYLIIKLLHDKNLSLSRPFSTDVRRFIIVMTYVSFLIGLFSLWGVRYTEWLSKQGVQFPDIEQMRLGGGDVWLFMSVILFVIAYVFKRGIEIQTENELTV
ncbi:MAG TPA: DUF2975 domain-containing protein [Chitinophagaceae bacterium]